MSVLSGRTAAILRKTSTRVLQSPTRQLIIVRHGHSSFKANAYSYSEGCQLYLVSRRDHLSGSQKVQITVSLRFRCEQGVWELASATEVTAVNWIEIVRRQLSANDASAIVRRFTKQKGLTDRGQSFMRAARL